jgi:hypothetical protein
MSNDICSTVYWYQAGEVRPFVKMPDWKCLLPGAPLARGEMDLPLPDRGSWYVKAPAGDAEQGIAEALARPVDPAAPVDGDGWTVRPSLHGFVDFNHVDRPERRGVGIHHQDVVSEARCVVRSPRATEAEIRVSWDDRAVLRLGGTRPMDLGENRYFRSRTVPVELRKGPNVVSLTLSNTRGTNHGGWCFAFRCRTADGETLLPEAAGAK